jgi:hypothetical protein
MPAAAPRARRDAVRFLNLLKAVALCRSHSDGRLRRCPTEIHISFADYCVAHRILASAFSSTFARVHPQALRLARAVRDNYKILDGPVTVKELAKSLRWNSAVTYKYAKEAISEKLVEYEPGSHVWNQKRLLPGIISSPNFLPAPRLVLASCPDINDEVSYVDPNTGKKLVLQRRRWNEDVE